MPEKRACFPGPCNVDKLSVNGSTKYGTRFLSLPLLVNENVVGEDLDAAAFLGSAGGAVLCGRPGGLWRLLGSALG